jgi:hypothetical protein
MVTQQQIKQFADYCEQHLDFSIGDPPGYLSAPICALDSVFSVGICYTIVVSSIYRFCQLINQDFKTSTITTSEVLTLIDKISDEELAEKYLTKHRTSTKNGILKATAYRMFLQTMQVHNVETCDDILLIAGNQDFENDIRNIPGQSSGITLDYLYILSRMDKYVKDDRHIQYFINEAFPGNKFVHDDRVKLIREAAKILSHGAYASITPRWLDHIIWNY